MLHSNDLNMCDEQGCDMNCCEKHLYRCAFAGCAYDRLCTRHVLVCRECICGMYCERHLGRHRHNTRAVEDSVGSFNESGGSVNEKKVIFY